MFVYFCENDIMPRFVSPKHNKNDNTAFIGYPQFNTPMGVYDVRLASRQTQRISTLLVPPLLHIILYRQHRHEK